MALNNPILFVATSDSVRARNFYERCLGFEFVAEGAFALEFQVGDRMLRIQKVEHVVVAPYTILGWGVADIAQEMSILADIGVRFIRYEGLAQDDKGVWHSPSGALLAWFQDPDGNTLSLTQFQK